MYIKSLENTPLSLKSLPDYSGQEIINDLNNLNEAIDTFGEEIERLVKSINHESYVELEGVNKVAIEKIFDLIFEHLDSDGKTLMIAISDEIDTEGLIKVLGNLLDRYRQDQDKKQFLRTVRLELLKFKVIKNKLNLNIETIHQIFKLYRRLKNLLILAKRYDINLPNLEHVNDLDGILNQVKIDKKLQIIFVLYLNLSVLKSFDSPEIQKLINLIHQRQKHELKLTVMKPYLLM